MSGQVLMAGAAEVDITPAPGTQIAGNIGVVRPVKEIVDRLYARALVLEQGGERLCVLSTDVLAIRTDYSDEIRRRAHERFGLDPACVMVHCTQNHHSPSVGHCFCLDEAFWRRYVPPGLDWILGGDARYNELFIGGVMDAIAGALARMRPVHLKAGRAVEGRISFNRRCILRDGTAVMHPPVCDPRIVQVEGPMDPEVSLLVLEGEDGRRVAALMHFSCHPDHWVGQYTVAGGWPGAWCEGMRAALGDGAVPMVVNGCCGNLHARNPIAPVFPDYREMGRVLTEDAVKILGALEDVSSDGAALGRRRKMLRIPLRELDPATVEAARSLLAGHPEPMWADEAKTRVEWEWVYAVSMLDLAAHRARQPWHDYEVQAFRIGGAALLALVGEPFAEGQLEIKLGSPAAYTQVAHMSNGYVGYVPTRAAIARGGFETRAAHWSKLAPEALETIARESLAMLKELFGS